MGLELVMVNVEDDCWMDLFFFRLGITMCALCLCKGLGGFPYSVNDMGTTDTAKEKQLPATLLTFQSSLATYNQSTEVS